MTDVNGEEPDVNDEDPDVYDEEPDVNDEERDVVPTFSSRTFLFALMRI